MVQKLRSGCRQCAECSAGLGAVLFFNHKIGSVGAAELAMNYVFSVSAHLAHTGMLTTGCRSRRPQS